MKPETTSSKGQVHPSSSNAEKVKPTVTNITRPRPVRRLQRSALITRNSNTSSRSPSSSRNFKAFDDSSTPPQPSKVAATALTDSEHNVVPQKCGVDTKKLPDYLALIYNFLWFPYHCIVKVYHGICFVISLPQKALDFTKFIASRPVVYATKAAEAIEEHKEQVFLWLKDNIEGFVNLCVDYHVGSLIVLAFVFWLFPIPNMTYPLFSLLRLVLGTLYPAYASYKAVRTKNVREYVSILN